MGTRSQSSKSKLRLRRKKRIRLKVKGTPARPRLSVFRSARHIYAQVIDDMSGITLASVNSFSKDDKRRANTDRCSELGKSLAQACKEKSIEKVVFDKNGYTYHGRVKALADGAREGGLLF